MMKDVHYPHADKYMHIHLIQTYMRQSLTWLMEKKYLSWRRTITDKIILLG